MLKTLHVMGGKSTGGAETYFTDLVTALQHTEKIQNYVLIRNGNPNEKQFQDAGIPIYHDSFNKFIPFFTKRKIKNIVEAEKIDIVQYWMRRAAKSVIKGPAIPIGWYGGYYEPKKFQQCDYHICVSYGIESHIIENGIDKQKVKTLHTFSDPYIGNSNHPPLEIPKGKISLLALTRLHKLKGIDLLIQSIEKLDHVHLFIAGDGPEENNLKKLVQDLNIAEKVTFLGWRNDRYNLLNQCDICVFPTLKEGFGTVMIEAWATKTPLIVADAEGPTIYCKHLENAYMVSRGSVSELTEAIQYCTDNPNAINTMVEKAHNDYLNCFTKQAVTDAYISYYQSLLNNRK